MIDAATGLTGRGHVCALLGRPETPWLTAARSSGLRVHGDIHGTWAQRVLRVRRAMVAERPDCVVTKAKKLARMAAFGRATGGGGRVVLFFGLTHELRAAQWIDRFTWRRVDAGIVVADEAARWYVAEGFGPPAKLHTLWKGVDTDVFTPDAAARVAMRAALGLQDDVLAVATVGRLAWQKGLDTFIAAVARARARLPAARFFVIGGGRDADQVAAATAAPELGGAVTLLGQRGDVPALLAAMDIVVQSSRQEVMAQTTLEAMAVGCPVISTRTMGAAEAIEDQVSGVLIPVEDADAIAAEMVALAADPARRARLGAAARARILAAFTTQHTLDRCEALFHSLLPTTRAAG